MRRLLLLACALLPLLSACKLLKHGGDAGADGAAAASASASASPSDSASAEASAQPAPSASTPATVHPIGPAHPSGPPAGGKPCTPAKDTTACSSDGFEELACVSGAWKVAQTCRGPGKCTGEGASLHCDVGTPQPGDACPANSEPRCLTTQSVLACKNGVWTTSVCMPPSRCRPNVSGNQTGCK